MSSVITMQAAGHNKPHGTGSIVPALAKNARTGHPLFWNGKRKAGPPAGTTTFKYDPAGRRIQKSGPLGTTDYLYEGMAPGSNIVEEVDSSGNVLAKYAQEPRVDGPLSMLRGGTTAYYEQDGINSVTSLSNPAGAVANSYTYDSFGKLTASTGTLTNPLRFTGRDYDAETNLQFNRTRYYDSGVGRFVSEDLIRFKGGIDFYAYVKNKPITFTDPTGTCLLQWDSVTATLGKCPLDPDKDRQCACLCQVSPEYAGCVKDCKDGCLSSKLNAVESCQCLCNKKHESGALNGFETWVCKQQSGWKMKTILLTVLLVTGTCSVSSGQAAGRPDKRVILPNITLVRCMTSDCFQLLQDEPPRPGDVYPEHINVAFLDRWCPFGLTARYNKAVSFEDLKDALEKRYGKGLAENWPEGPVVTWKVESANVLIELETADKRMAQNQHVEEGTKNVHYHDTSGKICPMR